jgi:signal transduction histidine kinase
LGTWSWDLASGKVSISREMQAIAGVQEPPSFAEQRDHFFSMQAWAELKAAYRHSCESGKPFHIEVPARRPDGKTIWVAIRGEAVRADDGTISNLRGTVQDISVSRLANESLRASRATLRRLVAHQDRVREDERKRIARDIHDDLGQNLMVLRIDLSLLANRTDQSEAGREMANAAVRELDVAIKAMRSIINDLRPPVLDLGVQASLEWLAGRFERSSGVACRVSGPPDRIELDDKHATCIFRIVQESLSNVLRHADASAVQIAIEVRGPNLMLCLADDGVGFPVGPGRKDSAFGLVGIEERVAALGGCCTFDSRPGQGLTICVSIPMGDTATLAVADISNTMP